MIARLYRFVLWLAVAWWCWKILETAGRQFRVLPRNLGWGYYVDLSIPVYLTLAAGLLFVAELVLRRLR